MQTNWFKESHSTEQLLESGKNEIWIKRDDLIHPIVSGNKWRKLKYILAHCKQNNIKHLITYGGAYSNHSIAAACVCSLNSIKCTIIIRGEKPEIDNHYTLMLKAFGAELVYISRTDYKDKETALSQVKFNKECSYILAEGGADALAYKGCAEIIESLENTYDAIFVASGTGTTALGMLQELDKHENPPHLHITPVLKNAEEIEKLCSAYSNYTVLSDAHLGGYAKVNEQVFEAINGVLKSSGILLDPIYTAKCYIALQNQIEKEGMKGKRILMVHTGGQMGLFSQPMISKWSANL